MRYKTSFVLFIIGLLIICSGYIQAAENLSLEEALYSGLHNNSNLKQSKIQEEKVNFDLELAKKSRYPSINLQSSYTRLGQAPVQFTGIDFNTFEPIYAEGSRNNFNTRLSIQQTIYGGGQIEAGIKQAQKALKISNLQTEQQKGEILQNIIQAYYNVLMARNRVEIEEEALELVREHKRIANASYKQGMVLKTDILQTEIKESESEQSLNNAYNQLFLARKNLANLIGIDQVDFTVEEPDLTPGIDLELDSLYRAALKNRTEFNQMSVNKEMVEINIEKEEKRYFPKLALTGNYNWQGSELDFADGSWNITISGSISLYDGGKSETTEKKYRKELSILDESKDNLKKMIKLDIERQILAVRENLHEIELHELNLEKARENLKLEKTRYKEGVGTNVDVMNAQTTLKQIKMGRMQAEYQYKLKLFDLLQTTGQLVDYCEEVIY